MKKLIATMCALFSLSLNSFAMEPEACLPETDQLAEALIEKLKFSPRSAVCIAKLVVPQLQSRPITISGLICEMPTEEGEGVFHIEDVEAKEPKMRSLAAVLFRLEDIRLEKRKRTDDQGFWLNAVSEIILYTSTFAKYDTIEFGEVIALAEYNHWKQWRSSIRHSVDLLNVLCEKLIEEAKPTNLYGLIAQEEFGSKSYIASRISAGLDLLSPLVRSLVEETRQKDWCISYFYSSSPEASFATKRRFVETLSSLPTGVLAQFAHRFHRGYPGQGNTCFSERFLMENAKSYINKIAKGHKLVLSCTLAASFVATKVAAHPSFIDYHAFIVKFATFLVLNALLNVIHGPL